MGNFYITGYRSYELGIYGNSDPKIKYLKKYLAKEMEGLVLDGVDWFLFAGNLGIEAYAFEELLKLKEQYPTIKLAVFPAYENYGQNWKGVNREVLLKYQQYADFFEAVTKQEYISPKQFILQNQFLLEHSTGSWLLYDDYLEPGKTKYFYEQAKEYQEEHDYQLFINTFDDLNDFINV